MICARFQGFGWFMETLRCVHGNYVVPAMTESGDRTSLTPIVTFFGGTNPPLPLGEGRVRASGIGVK